MKRLIYAVIVLVIALSLTFYSHIAVKNYCKETHDDINQFYNQKISAEQLEKSWNKRKEKMSAFVNHEFLDQISLYIGQITLGDNNEDENFSTAQKNIETLLTMIKDEQRLAAHNFY